MALHAKASQIASCVAYELEMVYSSVRRLAEGPRDKFDESLLTESMLLHTRVLKEFLFDGRREEYPSDVRAVDFLDNESDWSLNFIDTCPYLNKERRRIHYSLAHLSYRRLKQRNAKGKRWKLCEVWNDIYGAWQKFMRVLPAERREWFGLPDELNPFAASQTDDATASTSRTLMSGVTCGGLCGLRYPEST
jgi:hypothetical protein